MKQEQNGWRKWCIGELGNVDNMHTDEGKNQLNGHRNKTNITYGTHTDRAWKEIDMEECEVEEEDSREEVHSFRGSNTLIALKGKSDGSTLYCMLFWLKSGQISPKHLPDGRENLTNPHHAQHQKC